MESIYHDVSVILRDFGWQTFQVSLSKWFLKIIDYFRKSPSASGFTGPSFLTYSALFRELSASVPPELCHLDIELLSCH